MPAIILSDNGATSGSAGLKTSGGNDGVLQLQTTTAGGTPTTAISISNTQVVTYTNQPTYTGGTANGVLYLNGSKAVTSGTALVFDGTNLGVGITPVSSKLHVKQTTTAQGIKLESNANDSQIAIYNNNADPEWRVTATYGSTGSFQPLTFWTSDTKRLTLDTSGNLGLGVTPSAWWSSGKAYQVGSRTSLSDLTGDTHVTNNAYFDGSNWKYITSNIASNYYQSAGTHVWRYAGSGTAGATVAWTQAMTIDISGNLLVGTTTASGGITSSGGINTPAGFGLNRNLTDNAGRRNWGITTESLNIGDFTINSSTTNTGSPTTVRFQIRSDGSCYNGTGTYGTISDAKLKENVVDATPKLDSLMQVRVVNYNRIGEARKELGVIAQELEQIFPNMIDEAEDLVNGRPTGTTTKAVKYSVFVPMLIKAIQELKAEIDVLKGQA
jgi:hypothetical protein